MARMPGARWRPLADNWAAQPRMARYNLVLIHTAVGSFEGTYSYFKNSGGYSGAESHFMTGGAGEIDQYQDTAHQAEANGAANDEAISVENADMGPGFAAWNTNDGNAVPAFTPQQVEANAQICAWAHRTHGIPLELIPDSKPGRRGIGYHRLGVPGYMVPGAEKWSSATGKVCPGNRRIAQIPQIIARARQIVGGTPATGGPELDATERKMLEDLHRKITGAMSYVPHHHGDPDDLLGHILSIRQNTETLLPGVEGKRNGGDTWTRVRDIAAKPAQPAAVVDVDAEDIAEALASTPGFARTLAAELANELDRRARDNDPGTGPTT
jgi:hypothetical protein